MATIKLNGRIVQQILASEEASDKVEYKVIQHILPFEENKIKWLR